MLSDPDKSFVTMMIPHHPDGFEEMKSHRIAVDVGGTFTDVFDEAATRDLRDTINSIRFARLSEDPEMIRRRFLDRQLAWQDVIRHYGVILDLRVAEAPVLPKSTAQFREMMMRRAAAHWAKA